MATTLTKGATTITPTQVLAYSTSRKVLNIVHDILGRSDVDITYKAAGLRAGTLSMLFSSYASAIACESLWVSVGSVTVADSDTPGYGMKCVPTDTISVTLDMDSRDTTHAFYVVEVGFQEIL